MLQQRVSVDFGQEQGKKKKSFNEEMFGFVLPGGNFFVFLKKKEHEPEVFIASYHIVSVVEEAETGHQVI